MSTQRSFERIPPGNTMGADEIVPLSDLQARLGLGASAIRAARRRGLRIHRIGRKKFVVGRDLIAFMEAQT